MAKCSLPVYCVKDETHCRCRAICLEAIAAGAGEDICISQPTGLEQVEEFNEKNLQLKAQMLCSGNEPSVHRIDHLLAGGAAVVAGIKHERTSEDGHAVVVLEVTDALVWYMDPEFGMCMTVCKGTFEEWRLTKPPQKRSLYLEAVVVWSLPKQASKFEAGPGK